jgi:drug/metabolite transporter (DMT)-like permease
MISAKTAGQSTWQAIVPGAFVLLWATGFVFSKLGLVYARPFTFLLLRFALVAVVMLAASRAMQAPWPKSWREAGHVAVVGLLLQFVYLGGCCAAIAAGVPAGVTAVIVGLQPILTATVVGPFLGERVVPRQWLGLAVGFLGVVLVLWDKLDFAGLELQGVFWALFGLLGITAATIYQKRYCGAVDLLSGAAIQFTAASLATLPVVLILGPGEVRWTTGFVFSLVWLVLVLSIGAVSLLLWLIRRGAASRVASLFYMTPPVAALGSFFMFGERLPLPALAGMALAAVGVGLVTRA